jgi:hypothetical protein
MPAGRVTRQRVAARENDENSTAATTRTTRAKAAGLSADEPVKAALQPRKAGVNAAPTTRRRAVLGDVSNVGKAEVLEGKKATQGRVGLVSKAAQPTGVQKTTSTRAASTRAAAAKKEAKVTEVKRTGSGSGAIGVQPKRKAPTSAPATQNGTNNVNEPTRKKVHTERKTAVAPAPVVQAPAPKAAAAKVAAPKVAPKAASKIAPKAAPKAAAPKPAAPKPASAPVAAPPKVVAKPVEPVLPPGVRELDEDDADDPFMVAEYAHDIFNYMRELEEQSMPNAKYMDDQDDLEWKMRGILVDWLVEVHTRFHLLPETLFLTVNIIDRFLSAKVVRLDRLQLVGVTAMFIASKYEEVLSPHVSNFQRVTDDGFTEEEILDAERFLLSTLDYNLSYPNPMNFLRRVSKADNYDLYSRSIGKFLMEISLLDQRFIQYKPSHVAAAAMYLSRLILDRGDWDNILAFYAGYTEEELEPVVHLMVDYLARPVIHEAFFRKYANKKFLKASLLTRNWAKTNAVHFGIVDRDIPLDELP